VADALLRRADMEEDVVGVGQGAPTAESMSPVVESATRLKLHITAVKGTLTGEQPFGNR
jgi:hypothetical protein